MTTDTKELLSKVGSCIFLLLVLFGLVVGCNIDSITTWFDNSRIHDTTIVEIRDTVKIQDKWIIEKESELSDIIREYIDTHKEEFYTEPSACRYLKRKGYQIIKPNEERRTTQ